MTNEEMDKAILEMLRTRTPMQFISLWGALCRASGDTTEGDSFWRQVDRRLQLLRKRGLIVPNRKVGWSLSGEAAKSEGEQS